MTLARTLPEDAIVMVVGFLLPLISPNFGGDLARAERLALRLLADYHPQDTRELHLAAEAISHNLRALAATARAEAPNISDGLRDRAMRTACQFSRQGLQVQRRLDVLQRAPRLVQADEPVPAAAVAEPPVTEPATAHPEPQPPAPAAEPAAEKQPDALSDVTFAENALKKAQTLLDLMKARYKGAPLPHTKAAQEIQAQQRVVDMARMRLAGVRARQPREETATA